MCFLLVVWKLYIFVVFFVDNNFVHIWYDRYLYTRRNLFEILLNQTEVRFYLPISDWFVTANGRPFAVPNQSVHDKYNLISVWFNNISKRFLCTEKIFTDDDSFEVVADILVNWRFSWGFLTRIAKLSLSKCLQKGVNWRGQQGLGWRSHFLALKRFFCVLNIMCLQYPTP